MSARSAAKDKAECADCKIAAMEAEVAALERATKTKAHELLLAVTDAVAAKNEVHDQAVREVNALIDADKG